MIAFAAVFLAILMLIGVPLKGIGFFVLILGVIGLAVQR